MNYTNYDLLNVKILSSFAKRQLQLSHQTIHSHIFK